MKRVFNDRWEVGVIPTVPSLKERVDCTKIVTMGSCFARNITRWLNYHRYTNRVMPWDILYNPFSIYGELRRLYEPVNWQDEVYWEKSRTVCKDPWRTWFSAGSISELKNYNSEFNSNALRIVNEATAFLITYGLSEIWKLVEGSIVLNNVPLGKVAKLFHSYFPSVTDLVDVIVRTVKIIRDHISDTVPIIFTLSPVPLKRTASGMSIREANNLSKAILLVAIREVCNLAEGVYYFPSYEIIQALNETETKVWQEDGRHITAHAVNCVAYQFADYCNLTHKNTKKEGEFFVPWVNQKGVIAGRLTADGLYIQK